MLSTEDIARVTHEANRAYQLATGDPAPSPHWDDAPAWQRGSAIEGVAGAQEGRTPEQSHEGWLAHKQAVTDGGTQVVVASFAPTKWIGVYQNEALKPDA